MNFSFSPRSISALLVLLLTSYAAGLPYNFAVVEREEVLEPNEAYVVQWKVTPETSTVQFMVTAATTGFVGFGLSPAGGMRGADIVVGGVFPNGSTYFAVRPVMNESSQ